MIDTIKFKIPCSRETILCLQKKSTVYLSKDLALNAEKYRVYRGTIDLGSYSYGLNISIIDDDSFFLEFSIPKFLYNHNVLLFDTKLLYNAIVSAHNDLERFFNVSIPNCMFWQVYRIDFCYAWKFFDDLTVINVINYLKTFEFDRKTKIDHETSVMFTGSDYSIKFYSKAPEFFKHDWKRITASGDINSAVIYQTLARGVLRYEITYRHDGIMQLFGIDTFPYISKILDNQYIYDIMQRTFEKLVKIRAHTMSQNKAYEIIRRRSKTSSSAYKMFNFYRCITSSNPLDRLTVRLMARSTKARYLQKLRLYEIGIPFGIPGDKEINLTVPSPDAVGFFPPGSNTRGTSQNDTK